MCLTCAGEVDGTRQFGFGVPNKYTKLALTILDIGMMVQGIGKAPISPFMTTYVDNFKQKNSDVHGYHLRGCYICSTCRVYCWWTPKSRV